MQNQDAALDDAALNIFQDKNALNKFYGFMSNTKKLSFFQCVQVFAKNPDVTEVKSFDDWHIEDNRKIQKNSKGISVTDESQPSRNKYVFDLKQTYGTKPYKKGETLGDEELLKAIKGQCLWSQETAGSYRDKLFNAVADYCDNHFSDFTKDKTELMKIALISGVFACIVNRYNKPPEFIQPQDFIELELENSISVAAAVSEISGNLFNAVKKYRSIKNEKTNKEPKSQNSEQVSSIGAKQQTFFDIIDTDWQVRDTVSQLPSGNAPDALSEPSAQRRASGDSYKSAVGSGSDEGAVVGSITQADETKTGIGLSDVSSVREHDRAPNQRDNFRDDNLPAIVNYKLTEEHFLNRGGTKQRFHNNIAAIKVVYELESSGVKIATKEQKDILARYVGWGGIPQAFDECNEEWRKEYKELYDLLTVEDYRRAKETVLSAHYTPKTIIDSVYAGLKQIGLENGTILEPALGTGNFIGLLPDTFKSKVYGVELDNITGKIAKYLYPKSNIKITGFENTHFPDNFFDSVITNVPFGSFKVFDEDYKQYDLFIHDYFILKSLDKLRPGGIAAFITSKGTLDKANGYARRCFAERADLLGAIRLPNNAFKENANTEVTSDILFFKKKQELYSDYDENWTKTAENENGIWLNQYFLDNPDMVLGTMKKGKSMYGGNDETYCESDGRDLKEALSTAIKNLPSNIYIPQTANFDDTGKLLAQDFDIKNYCYAVLDDKIYLRINEELIPQEVSASNEIRLKTMIELRTLVRHILNIQIENCSDELLAATQEKLNLLYDSFVRRFGILNSKINKKLFRDDADYTLLISLENYDEINGTVKKTDIFSKRTIRKYERPEKADSAVEALQICKNETGKVDINIIEQLYKKSYDEIITELSGLIYKNPVESSLEDKYAGWETATEYLSGNVKNKLRIAETMSKLNPEFAVNAEALKKIQPEPLTAAEISVRVGVSWISPQIYKQFILEKFKAGSYYYDAVTIDFNNFIGEWKIEASYNVNNSFESTNIYGTSRMNGVKIFEQALNLRTPSVYDTIKNSDGSETRELNKPETIAVREKLRKLQEEFKAWVFDEQERRNELVTIYNEKFNNTVLAKYDGSYLDFPEMNPLIELQPHQKDAVERMITSGNTLLHHVVGAGKTFEIAAACMKMRQLKIAQKPLIIVPNHLVMQWANEFRTLYPNANLLIATKKDFEKENRLKFVSRIATGDWDAVVMAMSSFEKIPISFERQEKLMLKEIDMIEDALSEMRKDRDKRISVKDLQRVLKNKRKILEDLRSGKKDSLIRFEDLGVDYLFVDESHKYKNKFIFTKINNVAGLSRAMSKRSTDLDMKIDYIQELHNGQKGVVFATGTPISNSMVEMYTMQSYLQKRDLEMSGMKYFDFWAANFGETQVALELAPSGQGYRTKTRFAKFTNMPELLKMYRSFADVKTADMLNLPTPKANKHTITIKPTDIILELNDEITERAERISKDKIDPSIDNMLKITSDGKKLALDPRCYERTALDDPGHKVNICIENIYRIWNETKANRSTQVVFCDLSTPKSTFAEYNPEINFDIYNHVKYNLVNMGIPAEEVAYIHEAETDLQKQTLFDNVRNGKIRVLIGSTEKCGAGTNVQKKLIALHHLDTPYRPADMEQREGRIIRQGNENAEVEIFTYVTERTFDAYSYQILENKQRFISQINKGELTVREASDIDETTLTYAEIKAITSGNPLIKRKNEVENELGQLRVLQAQYKNNRYKLQDDIAKYLPQAVEGLKKKIAYHEQDIALRNANTGTEFSITINGATYTEKKDATELLHGMIYSAKFANQKVATIKGFDIIPEPLVSLTDRKILIKGNGEYSLLISESATGTMTRIENFFKGLEEDLESLKRRLNERESELITANTELGKPFEHEQKILDLQSELSSLDAQLDLNKTEIGPVMDDEKLQNEKAQEEPEEEDEKEREVILRTGNASESYSGDFGM